MMTYAVEPRFTSGSNVWKEFTMTQFSSLIRELMPAWLRRRSETTMHQPGTGKEPQHADDADAVWRKAVEKDLFGANTADYTETGQNGRKPH